MDRAAYLAIRNLTVMGSRRETKMGSYLIEVGLGASKPYNGGAVLATAVA